MHLSIETFLIDDLRACSKWRRWSVDFLQCLNHPTMVLRSPEWSPRMLLILLWDTLRYWCILRFLVCNQVHNSYIYAYLFFVESCDWLDWLCEGISWPSTLPWHMPLEERGTKVSSREHILVVLIPIPQSVSHRFITTRENHLIAPEKMVPNLVLCAQT